MRSTENPYAGQGSVLLDVGGDVGALLVTMPASWEGVEIEIRPRDLSVSDASPVHDHADHPHLNHVEVLPRPTPDGWVHCAVFPDLKQGRYELSERPFGQVVLEVAVVGGQIAQVSWPISDRPKGIR